MNNKYRYALLGDYDICDRNNIEILAYSDNIDELRGIIDAIDKLNKLFDCKDRYEPNDEILAFIEKHLTEIDIINNDTEYVYDIIPKGIFELKEVDEE